MNVKENARQAVTRIDSEILEVRGLINDHVPCDLQEQRRQLLLQQQEQRLLMFEQQKRREVTGQQQEAPSPASSNYSTSGLRAMLSDDPQEGSSRQTGKYRGRFLHLLTLQTFRSGYECYFERRFIH